MEDFGRNMAELPAKDDQPEILSVKECIQWGERYKSTPFNLLTLETASNKDHSPMRILRSLFYHVSREGEKA